MDRRTLTQELQAILEDNRGEKYPDFDETLDLRTGLGLDSVDMVSVVIDMQSRFNVEVGLGDLEKLTTVGQLLDLLEARLESGESGRPTFRRAA